MKMVKKMMAGTLIGTVFAFLVVIGPGCAKKPKVPNVEETQATKAAPTPAPTSAPAQTAPTASVERGTTHEGFKPVEETSAEAASRVLAGIQLDDIYFDFDKSNIMENEKPKLQHAAQVLRDNAGLFLTVEGHCDERGTNAYNRALGDRRAGSVETFLYDLGIARDRMTKISYGEEQPLCTAHNEGCWRLNRRVHFLFSIGGN